MSALAFLPQDLSDKHGASSSGSPSADGRLDEANAYRIELWTDDATRVERLLAVTITAAVGYAGYFAAAKDFPHRVITLRRGDVTICRWSVGRY